MRGLTLPGLRLCFRDITADDALYVTYWRNQPDARKAFYDNRVVTPDTHRAFVANRKPHDLVWMIEYTDQTAAAVGPIGMISLTVDVEHCRAEYGRLYIDPREQGKGLAAEAEYLLLFLAFEWLRLADLWLDAYDDNAPILALHAKTGWSVAGRDLPGHTDSRGAVAHMTYNRAMWRVKREEFAKSYPAELPAWA